MRWQIPNLVIVEYPASVERGGPPTDTPNLTAFFQELRSALPSAEISLATPSGYWFMKGPFSDYYLQALV